MPEPLPPRVLRAWLETAYVANGAEVRIGRRCPGVLLECLGARSAVLLTAWNPRSRRMPGGWNDRMQQRLRQCLHRRETVAALGSLGRWSEAMLLVAGDPRPLVRLAARFRQRGVVILCGARRARLRVL